MVPIHGGSFIDVGLSPAPRGSIAEIRSLYRPCREIPTIRPIGETRDQLGEGPVWDDRSERLLHVDILRGKCYTWRPADNQTLAFDVGGEVSAVIHGLGTGLSGL